MQGFPEFKRQSGLPFVSPGRLELELRDLLGSSVLQAESSLSEPPESDFKALFANVLNADDVP